MQSIRKYGSWKSPITSEIALNSGPPFDINNILRVDPVTDKLFWLESHPWEDGKCCLYSYDPASEKICEWTPPGFSAISTVHEYGGVPFCVYNNTLYFTNGNDQQIYSQASSSNEPKKVTAAGPGRRYADLTFCSETGKIYAVCEDHDVVQSSAHPEPDNYLVAIDPVSSTEKILVSGADFYSSPRVSPDCKYICWVQWFHPNMPWNSTEIWTALLETGGLQLVAGSAQKLLGTGDANLMQPSWSQTGELLYIGEQTGWWNLYRYSGGQHENLASREEELGGPWYLGGTAYLPRPGSSEIATVYGKRELAVIDTTKGQYHPLPTEYHNFTDSLAFSSDGNTIYIITAEPDKPSAIIQFSFQTQTVKVINTAFKLPVSSDYISVPEHRTFPTSENQVTHGFLYLPKNPEYIGEVGTLPPLLLEAHGGPTSAFFPALDLKIQYFTSRGFTVFRINYRGSTGYGKDYRQILEKKWGIHDIDDCCNVALHLASEGVVDRKKLCISGGSAGGYATLGSLAFKNVFAAGSSIAGVADIELLAKETHKFESRYFNQLVGPYPADKDVYYQRSPANFPHQMSGAVVFFQGEEDPIVPPNQALVCHAAVKKKGSPTALIMIPGEKHKFLKSENLCLTLDGTLYFFSKVLGFEAVDNPTKVNLHTLA